MLITGDVALRFSARLHPQRILVKSPFDFMPSVAFVPMGVITRIMLVTCVLVGISRPTRACGDDRPRIIAENAAEVHADTVSAAEIDDWVRDLSSDSYLRRKRATSQLTGVGEPAVERLVAQLDSGDLEVTERVLGILQEIASQSPVLAKRRSDKVADAPTGSSTTAWDELLRISELGGSQGSRAKVATDEVRDVRRAQAIEILAAADVFIGIADFTIGAITQQRRIVEIDDHFEGSAEVLSLLQWIDGIDYARVDGAAIRNDVLSGVVQMPDLKTLVLREGDIDADELAVLGDMAELRRLELRYVPMTAELIDQLATVPIRVSLTLNGTDAPADRVEALHESVPGLEIIFKQGGFLGVRCNNTFTECLILEVVPGQAAEVAGLLPGDVVVEIDGTTVKKFKDLQDVIDMHTPGDKIKIRFQRGGVPRETTATLGKLELP